MKYEVCIHNISQYLQMAWNKVFILQMSQPAQTDSDEEDNGQIAL